MKITTYHSPLASPDKAWLALIDFGGAHMNVFGTTEQKALDRANAWYVSEVERQKRIVGSSVSEQVTAQSSTPVTSRGQIHVGKVWMLNRQTGERARINESELSTYEANGFVRGGPRSK